MNTDIRLSIGFWQHPKTKKTTRRLGLEGIRSLQILWLWASANRPDGRLLNMDAEDVELAADWQGKPGEFYGACRGLWLDETPEGPALHDWQAHNPWQAQSDARSEAARKAARARWDSVRPEQAGRTDAENATEQAAAAAGTDGGTEERKNDEAPLPCVCNAGASNGQCPSPFPAFPSPASPDRKAKNTTTRAGAIRERRKSRERQGSATPIGEAANSVLKGKDGDSENAPPDTAIAKEAEAVPGMEFLELRDYYDRNGRAEGQRAGFAEYRQLRFSRVWPGREALYAGIERLREADGSWKRGFAPGLARFLRERVWEKEPVPDQARESVFLESSPREIKRQNLIRLARFVQKADGTSDGEGLCDGKLAVHSG